MRFAISLLSILAIASVIGTVLKQNEPYTAYQIEFGLFWFQLFELLGLFDVYRASWFLLILTFLVLSVSACVYRHLPGIVRDVRHFRENAKLSSLRAMHHHVELEFTIKPDDLLGRMQAQLADSGYRFRIASSDDVVLLAAKKGSAQKLGYLAAHGAIVVICIGGLLDGNLPLKIQQSLGIKEVETRNVPQSQIPPQRRLSPANLSFRGNVDMPEGGEADVVFVNSGPGYMVQELPFTLKLKAFHIEHYSTGQPKLFASDIEIVDKANGEVKSATVKVNQPFFSHGIAIYQASFGDGGSPLELKVWPWRGMLNSPTDLAAVSQNRQSFDWENNRYTLEFGDLRVFNIENMATAEGSKTLGQRMQDARQVQADKKMRNVGPSVQFKVRDAAGQAREYLNYLAPFESEGHYYLLSGVRSEVGAPFAFVRLPLDADFKLDQFMRLRVQLFDSLQHPLIVRQMSERALAEGAITPPFRQQFEDSVLWALQRFAEGGFSALENFLENKVPGEKRQAVAQTYVKLLQAAAGDAMDIAQDAAKLPRIPLDSAGRQSRFLMDSLIALSASFDYGSGFYLQPTGFKEVKSSGFQLTRSPGQKLVYFGCLLLVLGIFCMFYIRENRVWLRISATSVLLAFSANRRDSLAEQDFSHLSDLLHHHTGQPKE